MLEINNGFGSKGKPLQILLKALNWASMKIPVVIDLRKASFTRRQFGKKVNITEGAGSGCTAGGFRGPFAQLQIIASASVARATCGWDKDAIFSRSRCLVAPSAHHSDSSFILETRVETWIDSISGKLHHDNGMNNRQ